VLQSEVRDGREILPVQIDRSMPMGPRMRANFLTRFWE
jgi:hypothetical protein